MFHTTDFAPNSNWVPGQFALTKKHVVEDVGVVAGPGDILLARVGRNLEQKVGMVRRGDVLVTDCILVLRVKPQFRRKVFAFLTSERVLPHFHGQFG